MAEKAASETATPAEAATVEEEVGFGAAFAERSSDPQRDEVAGTQVDDEDGESEPSNGPADKAGSTEAPGQGAEEAGSGTEAQAFDPYAGMTPEQKSHWERLAASDRSNRGRVRALQSKLQGGTAAAAPAPKATIEQTETEGAGEETTVSDLDKRLQSAADEYGDVVGPLVEALAEVRKELASVKGTTSQIEELVNEQELTESYDDLRAVHPDFEQIAADENFDAWLGDQPDKLIEMANSFDPREVSLVLTIFKTERSVAMASQTGQGDDQGKEVSTATDTKRQRQLEGSRAVPSGRGPAASQVPNEFGSAFKARAAQQR